MIITLQLPVEIMQLFEKLTNIEKLLTQRSNHVQALEDDFLTIQQAAQFLRLSKATIYGLTSKGLIPFMKKGKRVYFSKAELTSYIKEGKRKTKAEIEAEADLFLGSQKRRRVNHG